MGNSPELEIKGKKIRIVLGGMGIGITGPNSTSAVANYNVDGWGTAGILSGIGLGLLGDYPGNYAEANQTALRDTIRATRKLSPDGVIGVNIMHALTDYEGLVRTAAKEDIDLIISGAGVPRDLPKLVENTDIVLGTIVSSTRFAKIMGKAWAKYDDHKKIMIVEGKKAGGHLGFDEEELRDLDCNETSLDNIVRETVKVVKRFGDIPVFAAGGIYTGKDIKEAETWGASGVQMGTRFVTITKYDANKKFLDAYIDAEEGDIGIIDSPVGMPGRAIIKGNPFLERIMAGEKMDFTCDYRCLKTCDPKTSSYCIAQALVAARQGNFEEGFAFAGTNAYRATEILPVETVLNTIISEYNS